MTVPATPTNLTSYLSHPGEKVRGTLAAASSITGALATVALLGGTLAGTSSITGALQHGAVLSGTLAGTSSVTGALAAPATLAGTLAGASSITGALAPVQTLAGTLAGASSITGALDTSADLAATLAGTSSITGALATVQALAGTLAGTSSITGALFDVATPQIPVTLDTTPFFIQGELAQAAILNPGAGQVEFSAILTLFPSEIFGGVAGGGGKVEPLVIAQHAEVGTPAAGSIITVGGETLTIREVRPSNTGIIRFTCERAAP